MQFGGRGLNPVMSREQDLREVDREWLTMAKRSPADGQETVSRAVKHHRSTRMSLSGIRPGRENRSKACKLAESRLGERTMGRSSNIFKGKVIADLQIIAAEQQESAREAGEDGGGGFEVTYDSEEAKWTVTLSA